MVRFSKISPPERDETFPSPSWRKISERTTSIMSYNVYSWTISLLDSETSLAVKPQKQVEYRRTTALQSRTAFVATQVLHAHCAQVAKRRLASSTCTKIELVLSLPGA